MAVFYYLPKSPPGDYPPANLTDPHPKNFNISRDITSKTALVVNG